MKKLLIEESGVIRLLPLLLIIAIIGLISFLLITSVAPFKGQFNTLYPKQQSNADTSFFIGFNITGISHYGYPNLFPFTKAEDIDNSLSEINRIGANVIRIFVANQFISDAESAERLNLLLLKANQKNINVIVSFIDFYGTPYRPINTAHYYTDSWNGTPLLGREFFESGYKGRYKEFVQAVVQRNKHHTNIYAWEIGNELKYDYEPVLFRNFMADVSAFIKQLDPSHQVATGMIHSKHTNLSPSQLYPFLPHVDIITVHSYDGDHAGTEDVQWANANGKITFIEEIGFGGTHDRSTQLYQEIEYWKNVGAMGIMPWGFIAKGFGDNGNGDKVFGMDTVWHTDYDKLVNVFNNYVAPGCSPNNVQMSVSPNSPKVGDIVTFNLSGSEGSTHVGDNWSGGVNCSGGFWGSKSCSTTTDGNFTWTHSWKNCATNNCAITSDQCSKQLNFSITSPTQTPTPNPACNPLGPFSGTPANGATYLSSTVTLNWTTKDDPVFGACSNSGRNYELWYGRCTMNNYSSSNCTQLGYENGRSPGGSHYCGFEPNYPTNFPSSKVLSGLSNGWHYWRVKITCNCHYCETGSPPADSGYQMFHVAVPTPTPTQSPSPTPTPIPSPTPIPGDVDGNRVVNIFDYNILVTNFGQTGINIQGDIDKNGVVNIFDYNILVGNFGKTG